MAALIGKAKVRGKAGYRALRATDAVLASLGAHPRGGHSMTMRASYRRLRRTATLGVMSLALAASALADGASPGPPPLPFDVTEASIADMDAALASGRVSSRQLVEAYLARIAAYDQAGPKLNAIVTLNRAALAQADALDRERQTKGPRGPLHGIPVLVKDNYDTADMPTSGGTLALATLRPSADAVQVAKLRAAGAIILGKTAMHELASGVTTVSSLTGYSRNPYDPARSPGGSSGGTGAAVSASFAAAGMGSDTCGSIRIPSAYNALVGLRGTPGLSSTTGIMPLSHTQDVGGPLARSVADLAIMLDATVEPGRPSYRAMLQADGLKGARIGVLRGLFSTAPEDKEGQDFADRTLAKMREAGAVLSDVAIPGLDDLLKDSSVTPFEFKYDLAAYLAERHAPVGSLSEILSDGLNHDALDERLRLRDAPTSRDDKTYAALLERRHTLHDLVTRIMAEQKLDALIYPTTLRRPPMIGTDDAGQAPNCQFAVTAGLPVVAIPAGFTDRDLPIGFELLGASFTEPTLIRLAYGWERAAHPRKAPFSTPPLVDGKGPAPIRFTAAMQGGTIDIRYDPTTATLDMRATVNGIAADQIIALTLHRSRDGAPGPILTTLLLAGQASGEAHLSLIARDRAALLAGGLYVALYTRAAPLGAARAALILPHIPR